MASNGGLLSRLRAGRSSDRFTCRRLDELRDTDDGRNTVTGEESSIDATGLFIAIGNAPHSELVLGQVDTGDGYVLLAHPTTHTNFPGVFACFYARLLGPIVSRT
jgi:thioredoxin reductase